MNAQEARNLAKSKFESDKMVLLSMIIDLIKRSIENNEYSLKIFFVNHNNQTNITYGKPINIHRMFKTFIVEELKKLEYSIIEHPDVIYIRW